MISSYHTITQSYTIAVGTHNAFTTMPLHRQLPWSVEADNPMWSKQNRCIGIPSRYFCF